MNTLQETILDQLMVADTIGAEWTPGPLRLAVQALRKAGLTTGHAPHTVLGYPPALCQALEGASTTLPAVDQVRALAISVFTEISPRKKPPRLGRQRLLEIASWTTFQADLLHSGPAEMCAEVRGMIAGHRAAQAPSQTAVNELSANLQRTIRRVRLKHDEVFSAERLRLSVSYFALHALRKSCAGEMPDDLVGLACRDTGRLASLVKGTEGAILWCINLARQVGM